SNCTLQPLIQRNQGFPLQYLSLTRFAPQLCFAWPWCGFQRHQSPPDEPESFDTSVDWSFLPNLAEIASHRLPLLKDTGVVRAQAGLHEDTPDANAIIGKVPEMDGLCLACGFSGHGFMHSPAVGRIVAGLVLKKTLAPELLPFTLERFKLKTYQKEQCFI
ncbi:FAD-binding oxidoreductase, partial [Candidatus Poribacteria bacterium]|nr:FAD-binding oxidoreductase [Candidatus Poribacteria bacterium]